MYVTIGPDDVHVIHIEKLKIDDVVHWVTHGEMDPHLEERGISSGSTANFTAFRHSVIHQNFPTLFYQHLLHEIPRLYRQLLVPQSVN